jgi:nucleoside-diphosphate-sugar epimerase
VARLLAAQGERVRVVTRSGRGPSLEGVELVAADASGDMVELTKGATAVYNCANPAYHRWLTDWLPINDALLRAATANDAVLATMSNLYGYGPVDGSITEQTPLAATHPKLRVRARMWADALASGARVTEARASDYVGYRVNSVLEEVVLKRTLKGQTAYVYGDPDAPRSWSNVDDTAATLVTIARDERAWGRAWHVPTDAPLSMRATAELAGGGKPVRLKTMPYAALWTLGLFSRTVKELRATYYQFARPFVLDSTLTQQTFGLKPTPLADSLAAVADAYRNR